MVRQCTFEDCNKKHDSRGYCSVHAFQFRKYGHPLSAEEKHENHSRAAKERIAKNGHPTEGKTYKQSPEARAARRGKRSNTGRTHFKKGQTAHNRGVRLSQETRDKISQALKGRVAWNKGTVGMMKAWNKVGDGITSQNKLERTKFRKTTQILVFQRDNYTCQRCDQYSGNLQVDHIKSWADYPELRFDLDNCRTLCMACHYYITFKRKMPEGTIWGHNLSRRIES